MNYFAFMQKIDSESNVIGDRNQIFERHCFLALFDVISQALWHEFHHETQFGWFQTRAKTLHHIRVLYLAEQSNTVNYTNGIVVKEQLTYQSKITSFMNIFCASLSCDARILIATGTRRYVPFKT